VAPGEEAVVFETGFARAERGAVKSVHTAAGGSENGLAAVSHSIVVPKRGYISPSPAAITPNQPVWPNRVDVDFVMARDALSRIGAGDPDTILPFTESPD
jgi:hypothetical protein